MAPPPSVITVDAALTSVPVGQRPAGTSSMPAAATTVAFLRMLIVVACALTGSLWSHPTASQAAVFYLWGLGWLPWSILLVFATSTSRRRFAAVGGVVGDIAVLLTSLAVFDSFPGPFMVGIVLALLAGWMTWETLPRVWSTIVVGLATTAVRLPTSPDAKGIASSAAFLILAAIICLIWMRTERITSRAEVLTSSLRSRAETVLARVPHPLVISGANGRIVSCNPATLEVIGEFDLDAPCCEALGLHVGERALDCTHGCALLALCRESDGGYAEVWRLRSDGTRQPLVASAAEIPDSTGRVVEVVHSLRDITRLKEADEAKTIFLATASHELKTPLTVINGYAQLLMRDEENVSLRRQGLEAISSRAKELAGIVERLLLSSHIESGRLTVTLVPLDLAAVVRERAEALATATNHGINIDIAAGLPPVDADATAMATVLDHLVDNAIKYTPDDAPVDVMLRRGESWVTLSIRDHGHGMSAEQARHCFDKFWQAESGDSRRHGGTGLGLYIVKSLVDSMGGRITVESEPGKGTAFHVTLPSSGGQLPGPRHPHDAEPSMIKEFMRQIGVSD